MRLIDADSAIELIKKIAGNREERRGSRLSEAIKMLGHEEYTPTIEAEPVRHGHWIYGESWMLGTNRRCSVCDSMFPCNDSWVMFYCPDCGAKMDEVDNLSWNK